MSGSVAPVTDPDVVPWRRGAVRPTARAIREFIETKGRRGRVGLCLSGGGYRAALFHLGALRRLNELGVLSRIDIISAVSGGSILAAFLADRLRSQWPAEGTSVADWDRVVERPFRAFTEKYIRTRSLCKLLSGYRPVEALRAEYATNLSQLRLSDLPNRPSFVFGATELVYRRYWSCSRELVGSSATGYFKPTDEWTVARAVAASSCFPPVFPAMNIWKLVPKDYKSGLPQRNLLLSDGGIYDNTGYLGIWNKCDVVLVSDGGGVTDIAYGRSFFWRLRRYQTVQEYGGRGSQKAWLLSNLISGNQDGAYWGLRTKTSSYGAEAPPSYPKVLVNDRISTIRTDLDKFAEEEQMILINHGYLLAAAAIQRYVPALAISDVSVSVPYSEWMDPEKVEKQLSSSHKVYLLPRDRGSKRTLAGVEVTRVDM